VAARGKPKRLPASRLVAGFSGFALVTGLVSGLVIASAADDDSAHLPGGTYVLRADSGNLPSLLDDIRARGGTVTGRFDSIDGAAVTLDADTASALAADGRVASLTPDADLSAPLSPAPATATPNGGEAPVATPKPARTGTATTRKSTAPKPASGGTGSQGGTTATDGTTAYNPAADPNSLCNIAKLVGVRQLWKGGGTGKGVDVALIDSGVAPVPGLNGAGKVVNGPDLSPESQNPATRYLDTFGHGTHMAGIIAGKDANVDTKNPASCTGFAGMAPDARVVSVKAADAHGATDAAEVAWHKGIVVVVSAGNSGFDDGRLTNPARNPYVLAVGADDTKGTASTLDDTIPSFSSRGDAKRNPDIVAPGNHVQSLRVPGSYIDWAHGDTGRLAGRFFRGSGTSQAAAVTSGAVAALLSARPNLTPEQVKLLTANLGLGLIVADPRAQGHGLLQLGVPALAAALTSPPVVGGVVEPVAGLLNQLLDGQVVAPKSTGTGTLEGARGKDHLELDGKQLTGEQDIFGKAFNSVTHASLAAAKKAWNGGTWNGSVWTGNSWTGRSWASSVWLGRTWAGRTWAGRTWADGSWNGRTWANGTWNGRTWAGVEWAGRTWAGTDFAGGDWQ